MKTTQQARILEHLRTHGTITSREAMMEYGIIDLPTRIFELIRKGYNIVKTMTDGTNKFGETVRYAVYSLKEERN